MYMGGLDINFNVMHRLFYAFTINSSDTYYEILSNDSTKEILKVNYSVVAGIRKSFQTPKRTIELGISYHYCLGYSNSIISQRIMNKYHSQYTISPKLSQISIDVVFYRKNRVHKKIGGLQ